MPAVDKWANLNCEPGGQGGFTSSAFGGEAVTPNDGADLAFVSRALYVGGDGNVAVVMHDGSALTFVGLKAGTLMPLRVSRVKSTGTTATSLVSLY